MSVDFYECEYCQESIYEGSCYARIIDGNDVYACDWCIADEIKKGNLIRFDEDSDEYETLTDKEKENIRGYGSIYRRTQNGKHERIQEIDNQIARLQQEKEELLKMSI